MTRPVDRDPHQPTVQEVAATLCRAPSRDRHRPATCRRRTRPERCRRRFRRLSVPPAEFDPMPAGVIAFSVFLATRGRSLRQTSLILARPSPQWSDLSHGVAPRSRRTIGMDEVEGRRRDLLAQCEDGEDRLRPAGGAERMACRRLLGAGRDPPLPDEHSIDGCKLAQTTDRRRGRMRVQVMHVARRNPCPVELRRHGAGRAFAAFRSGGDVAGVRRRAVADDFRERLRPSTGCLLQALDDETPGALAHDEAVAIAVEWPGGAPGRPVEPGRKSPRSGGGRPAADPFRRPVAAMSDVGPCRLPDTPRK